MSKEIGPPREGFARVTRGPLCPKYTGPQCRENRSGGTRRRGREENWQIEETEEMNEETTTLVRPGYRRTSAGHKPIDGVQFFSYSTGILSYARISEDGQILVCDNGHHRNSYRAVVLGHGTLQNEAGETKRFRSQDGATKAAIKVWRKLQAEKK